MPYWKIFTTLNDLYYVERFLLRWKICIKLRDLYYVERFVQRCKMCTALNYLYKDGRFELRWIICTTLNHMNYDGLLNIHFLMSADRSYSRKYCNIFYTNCWVDFFLIKLSRRNIVDPAHKVVIKKCFWSLCGNYS